MSFPCLKTFNGPHFPKGKTTFQTSSPTIPYRLPFPSLQVLAHAVHSAYSSPLGSWVSKIPFITQDSLSSLRSSNSKHTPLPFTEQVPCCAPFLWQQLWHWLVLNYLCICLVSPTWPRSPWRQGPYADVARWAHRRMWDSPIHGLNKRAWGMEYTWGRSSNANYALLKEECSVTSCVYLDLSQPLWGVSFSSVKW